MLAETINRSTSRGFSLRSKYIVLRRVLAESVLRQYSRTQRKLSKSHGDGRFIGCVDRPCYRVVTGWAYDTKRPNFPAFVRCVVNGVELGITVADRHRNDVAKSGHPTGVAGFEFAIPDYLGEIASLRVFLLETGSELPHVANDVGAVDNNRPLPNQWKDGDKFRFPSAFVLGPPKCGTTSLYTYLEQHPDFCMSKPKEPRFFESEFRRGQAYYFNRYFSHWKGQPNVVDARVLHLYLPYIPQRLFNHNPKARLIAVLRNPAERAISHWWHGYSRGFESLLLGAAIAEDLKRIEAGYCMETPVEQELYERTVCTERRMFRFFLDAGYYYEQILRFLRWFPKEQLHVMLFDDLARDPQSAVAGALEFLGADPEPASGFLYPVIHRSDPQIAKYVDPGTISWLVEHYRPHNRKLQEILGRSIEHWDHPFERSKGRSELALTE